MDPDDFWALAGEHCTDRELEALRLRATGATYSEGGERLGITKQARVEGQARMKQCRTCHETKPLSDYPRYARNQDGRDSRCRVCRSAYDRIRYAKTRLRPLAQVRAYKQSDRGRDTVLQREYGITLAEWQSLYLRQGGGCAICSTPLLPAGGGRGPDTAHVDHCHETGVVRGLLCHFCNKGLGHFRDDPQRLQDAITYLSAQVRAAA